jgi:hypothetical protein
MSNRLVTTVQACSEAHPPSYLVSAEIKAAGAWRPPLVLFTLRSKQAELAVRPLRVYAYIA